EVSQQVVDGQVTGLPEAEETAERILSDLDSATTAPSKLKGSAELGSSGVEANMREPTSSLSVGSGGTIGRMVDSGSGPLPPRPPSKDPDEDGVQVHDVLDSHPMHWSNEQDVHAPTGSILGWTSSLSSAMRSMLSSPSPEPSRPSSPRPHAHGLLPLTPVTDERPHVRHEWTVGRRVRVSCTVYYARQFDALRRRCGVADGDGEGADGFVSSLARCEGWEAQGGKSRSNFWKTRDDRFVIKTLVNAWNVADLQVLLDLAPAYFRHVEASASRASVLAKFLGFYTVEVRNLEGGSTTAQDLLVMENVFYGQAVGRTFDLKGIQGRRVKQVKSGKGGSAGEERRTLFDGEWMEGQSKALTLVHPHSKIVLQEGIKADCDFLARSNIMDYSLLLGVDVAHKRLACGLVDTIGSYTFAKTLEYRAKHGLRVSGATAAAGGTSAEEVTVLPPREYEERFVSAMDAYFLACPDKWSKPPEDGDDDGGDGDREGVAAKKKKKVCKDPSELPSVLS
ncbi:hypothetical protein EW146_g7159, partial [Bondarzewia mesenterica]